MKKKKLEAKLSETKKELKKVKSKLEELISSAPVANGTGKITKPVADAEQEASEPTAIKKPAAKAARK